MKIRNRQNDFPIHISQIDLLFCTIIFILIVMVTLSKLVNTKESKEVKKEEKVMLTVEAALSVSITWPKGPEDIDLWVTGPDGRPVGYQNTRSESLGYLRDDTGSSQNDIGADHNYELVTAHKFKPGHYVVNLHYFSSHGGKTKIDIKVKILLKKKDEGTEVIYNDTVRLHHEKYETTVVQFDLLADGSVVGKTTDQKPLFKSLENHR